MTTPATTAAGDEGYGLTLSEARAQLEDLKRDVDNDVAPGERRDALAARLTALEDALARAEALYSRTFS